MFFCFTPEQRKETLEWLEENTDATWYPDEKPTARDAIKFVSLTCKLWLEFDGRIMHSNIDYKPDDNHVYVETEIVAGIPQPLARG